jgi:hypothetical protein
MPCFGFAGREEEEEDSPSRHDELEHLLEDADRNDSDILSLHSDFGRSRKRHNHLTKWKKKRLLCFGRNPSTNRDDVDAGQDEAHEHALFGLSEDDDRRNSAPVLLTGNRLQTPSRRWEPTLSEEQLRQEELIQSQREERRAARRLRKIARQPGSKTLDLTYDPDLTLEGTQTVQGFFTPATQPYEAFGPFTKAQGLDVPGDVEEDADDIDFGAELYTAKRKRGCSERASDSALRYSDFGGSTTSTLVDSNLPQTPQVKINPPKAQ